MISVYCITFVVFLFEGSVIPIESFKVIRGENDKFSNPSCSKGSGNYGSRCEKYCEDHDAECDTSTACKYCICEGDETYYESKCVGDEDILQDSDCKHFSDVNYIGHLQLGTCTKDCLSEGIYVRFPRQAVQTGTLEWSEYKYIGNRNSWKSVEGRENIFAIEKETDKPNKIKIITNDADALRAWNGSLLKLAFTYKVGRKKKVKQSCVILKVYTLQQRVKEPNISKTSIKPSSYQPSTSFWTTTIPSYLTSNTSETSIKPSSYQPSTSFWTTIPSYLTSNTSEFGTNRFSHRTNNGLSGSTTVSPKRDFPKRDFRSGSSSSKTVAVSVSIVLLVLILFIVFGFLLLYRRRKRNQQQQENRTEMQSQNQRTIDEGLSPMYEELKDDERQIDTEEGYQSLINPTENPSDTTKNVYDYIDTGGQKMKDPGSNEDEYSYASNDEVARDFAVLPQPSAPDSTVYHTLEEPQAAENPTPTHDGSSGPLDHQAKNPVYAILEESNVESGEAREVEPEKDPSEEFRASPEDNDPYYHVLDNSEKSV